jgi:signal transduction histidine kinase
VRVLLLFQQQAESVPMQEFTERLSQSLREEMGSTHVEFFHEDLDIDRLFDRERSGPLVRYLADKYNHLDVDVVVPVGGRALTFAITQLRTVLGNVPIVFALCAAPQTNPSALSSNVTGRLAPASRFVPTVMMARRLQPDAERIVVVGGAGPADSTSVRAALSAAQILRDSLSIEVIQGLPLAALLPKLRQIPPRSIVIFANYRQNGHGRSFEPLDIVGSIARAAAAPMYTQLLAYVGEGVVGGSVTRFDVEGDSTARLIVRVLKRRRGEAMPPIQTIENSFVVDWRQLGRWRLAEERLPGGTELLFREATAWQRYRAVLVLALVITAAELLLIARLLVERRQRKRGQAVLAEEHQRAEEARRQIAHMGRVALVGELAATIAHEIRQPLTAMRTNAEAGAILLRRTAGHLVPAHRQLCEELFGDIIADNERASEIITRVRALLRHEEAPLLPVDLNEVCRVAARLLEAEAANRRSVITLSFCNGPALVLGDAAQFQQVVLNLALNALDAASSAAHPHVVISTSVGVDAVEIAVRDNGRGLPLDVQQHLFQSFFTTKPTGLGLGLVIVQSIAERHGGRVCAENDEHGGARFRVVMPPMPSAADARAFSSSLRAIPRQPCPSR